MRGICVPGFWVGCAMLGFTAVISQAASLTVFDDALQNNFSFTQPAKSSIDTTLAYEGSSSVKLTPAGNVFDQVGLAGGGPTPAVPADSTTFTMAIYVSDPTPAPVPVVGIVAQFILQLGGPTFQGVAFGNSNGILAGADSIWTLDGLPGTTTFTTNTWHVLTFDVEAAFPANFIPGTTQMLFMNVQANGDASQRQINVDSAAFVGASVPEPASAALLSVGGLFVARRGRRNR